MAKQVQRRKKQTKHVSLVPSKDAVAFIVSQFLRAMPIVDGSGRIVALVNPDKARMVH